MRVLVWATHLQTDILAVAAFLDRRTDVELLIVTPDAETFRRQPVAAALNFAAPILDRGDPATMAHVRAFAADVAVADNHVPPKGAAPRLFYMWHGLGWKARSALDLSVFYRQVRRLTGRDPRRPNPRFLAQCYGPSDRAWRIRDWRLPAEACPEIGMAFAALLLDPPYSIADIAERYRIDIRGRKTVLLTITWHSGGALDGAYGDLDLVRRLLDTARSRAANLLVCLHDRQRYDPDFVSALESALADQPDCEIRFKNEHPDNLSDLLVADVMVSNLSSFLTYHYVLARPSVHIVPAAAKTVDRVAMLFSRFRVTRRIDTGKAWMIDPADTGGARVTDASRAALAVAAALDDPAPGGAAARAWLDRHIPLLDGRGPERVHRCLLAMCSGAVPITSAEALASQPSDGAPARAAAS